MKYIVVLARKPIPQLFPLIFPAALVHKDVFNFVKIQLLRLGFDEISARSAGECNFGDIHCSGSSETLGISSHESDSDVIGSYEYFHGTNGLGDEDSDPFSDVMAQLLKVKLTESIMLDKKVDKKEKKVMTLDEAKLILNACNRYVLRDHAFGDMEVSWSNKNGVNVGSGYFGTHSKGISVCDAEGNWTEFTGAEADELVKCGCSSTVERNDETGPDEFVLGQTMPGLTLEGVRKELEGEKYTSHGPLAGTIE